ncbi:MAG: hypothetical protein U0Z44_05675 [Kouleothrix sp.]
MAQLVRTETSQPAPPPARRSLRPSWAWIGVLPFFGFVAAFLFYPALSIAVQTFFDRERRPTLQNLLDQPAVHYLVVCSTQSS